MKKRFAALLTAVLLCLSCTGLADVVVQNDHISAYLDSTGGVILTGYDTRINATDAYTLVAIDATRVVYLVETGTDGVYNLVCADFATSTETVMAQGVTLACGYGGEGIYFVTAQEPAKVQYLTYGGALKEIYSSEENVEDLQISYHGLMICFAQDAGAVVLDGTFGMVSEYNGQLGVERRVMNGKDLILTASGDLYLDDPTQIFTSKIAGDVDQFETMDGYVYYITEAKEGRVLRQYSPDTLSWQDVNMNGLGQPQCLTASYDQALVMADTGKVYAIRGESCTVTEFATVTVPQGVDMKNVSIRGVSGQLNVYAQEPEDAGYVLAFNFNFVSDSGNGIYDEATQANEKTKITLLAMTPLSSEINTFDILTPARKYQVLSYGSRGDAVSELQQALTDLGYLNDKVDGIFGPRTRYAVRLFQDFNGFKVTGIADKDTQEYLFDGNPPVYDKYRQISYGARGLRVTEMQERLRYLGYMADPADGIYGPYTREGVRLFQEENGLNQSGVADAKTLKAIYSVTAPKCSSYFEMNYGDSGWRVRAMNRRLKELYYLEGTAGSTYNSATKAAVKLFQRECGMVQSGVASAYMQQKLFSRNAPTYSGYITLRRGDNNDRVAELQRRLRDLGYLDSGDVDGYYGRRTAAAVKEFQKMAGLPITGVADPVTQELLFGPDAPYKPVIAEISAPKFYISNYSDETQPGRYTVNEGSVTIGWQVTGSVDGYYMEITDGSGCLVRNGYLYDTEIKLDVTALHANEAYTITISAIPENGTMKNAKTSSITIVTPVQEEPTPEPTPVPTPEVLPTVEPTPTPEVTPVPPVDVPVISVSGDYAMDGNVYVVGAEGARFAWTRVEGVSYNLTLKDAEGNAVKTLEDVSDNFVTLQSADLTEGVTYTLEVRAYYTGTDANAGRATNIQLTAASTQPDPTEPPATEAPVQPIVINITVINADKIGDTWYLGQDARVEWQADGDVKDYSVEMIDGQGNVLSGEYNTAEMAMNVDENAMVPGETYGLRITANGEGETVDETVYLAAPEEATPEPTQEPAEEITPEPTEAVTEEPTVEPTEEPTPEPTEEPTPEPTEEPTPEPTEEPTPEPTVEPTPEPTVEPTPVQVQVTVDDATLADDVYYIGEDTTALISWSSTGEANNYTLYLKDAEGNVLQQADNTEYTAMYMAGANLPEGNVYSVTVVAHEPTGDVESTIYIARAAAQTEAPAEPTEAPAEQTPEVTPEPVEEPAHTVSQPTVNVENYANFDGNVYWIDGDSVTITWSTEGDLAYYNVYLYGADGTMINSAAEVTTNSLNLNAGAFEAGSVYTLTICAVPVDGTEETGASASVNLAKTAQQPAEPEVTPEPEQPAEPEVTPEPEQPAEPVYNVSAPVVNIEGSDAYDGVNCAFTGDLSVSWYAEGDVGSYDLYLYDQDGNVVSQAAGVTQTSMNLAADNFAEGAAYTLEIVAIPVNGTAENGASTRITLTRTAPAQPEQPAEPEITPEPQQPAEPVYNVSAPVVNIEGSDAYDGVNCAFTGDLSVSWYAEGDVGSYDLYLYDQDGNVVSQAAGVTQTSMNLAADNFAEGAAYTLEIVAIPVNGTAENGASTRITLTRTAPAQPEQPAEPDYTEPEQPAEPDYTEPEQPAEPDYTEPGQPTEPDYTEPVQQGMWDTPLDGTSDWEKISNYQRKLVEWGWMSFDGEGAATEGVFDQTTMIATRNLQEYINSLYVSDSGFVPLEVIDLNADAPYVGVDTLQLIMPDTATQTFVNPDMM